MNVLLIDDHSLFRDGISLVLANLDSNIKVNTANSYEDALPFLEDNHNLDIVLLDLGLPGLSDVAALQAVRQKSPTVPVVVLSATNDASKIQEALSLGAQGYIPKSTDAEVLVRALKLVLSGGIYIPSDILPQLNEAKAEPLQEKVVVENPLTQRQKDVLSKVVQGYSNKEISSFLGIAEATVRVHIAAILKMLDVANRTKAAFLAVERGWVEIEAD